VLIVGVDESEPRKSIAELLDRYIPNGIPVSEYLSIHATWVVSVKNLGKQKSRSASLYLPINAIFAVIKNDSEQEIAKPGERLVLGDIFPGDEVLITAWASNPGWEHAAKQIRISDDSGSGSVVVRAPFESLVWRKKIGNWFAFRTKT
jgi:hypothetical protein